MLWKPRFTRRPIPVDALLRKAARLPAKYRPTEDDLQERAATIHAHFQLEPGTRLAAVFNQTALENASAAYRASGSSIRITRGESPEQLQTALATAEILVFSGVGELRDLASSAPRLRWIHCTSAGVDQLSIDDLPPGVVLTNSRGVHAERAAEFTITALLMLNNAIPQFTTAQAAGEWRQLALGPIAGKLVVILGTGVIGQAAAASARRFGMSAVGVSRSGTRHPDFDENLTNANLHSALRRADFLLVTLPATPATNRLVDRAALDCLPSHAGVINIGRGSVIDNDALVRKLTEGTLRNAILDVVDEEPLPKDSPLWHTPNLIITPHSGLYDVAYGERCLKMFAENLERFLGGKPLHNQVDLARGY